MPFEPVQTREKPVYAIDDPIEAPEAEAPSFWSDTMPAAFRIDNPIGSLIAQEGRAVGFPLDPDYDPFPDMEGYEGYEDALIQTKSADHMAALKADIDRETEDRKILAASGGAGIAASLAAGLVDPVNLLPGGVIYRGGKMGFAVGRTALSATASGAAAVTVSEAALQGTQETRTIGESAVAVGAGALLSGVIGGAVGAYGGRKALDDLVKRTGDDFRAEYVDPRPDAGDLARASDAGAARVERTTLDQETPVSALGMEKMMRALNPVLRLTQSPSKITRDVAGGLIENPLYLKKNQEGIASQAAVETLAKEGRALLYRGLKAEKDAYKVHRKSGGSLSRKAFAEEVGRAMRRGDMSETPGVTDAASAMRREMFDPLKDKAIEAGLLPEGVEPETAVSYLSRVYNREKIVAREPEFRAVIREWTLDKGQQAIRAERLPLAQKVNDLRTNIEALLRRAPDDVADTADDVADAVRGADADVRAQRILDDAQEQADALRKEAAETERSRGFILEGVERAAELRKQAGEIERAAARRANILKLGREDGIAKTLADVEKELSLAQSELRIAEETKFDLEAYALEIEDSLVAKLKGYDAETQPYRITVAERGPLAERTFDIQDEVIEDFLESDVDLIAQRYQRVMSADIELARKYGDPTMKPQIDEINSDYAELAKGATTERERKLLETRRREDVRDIEAMRDLIRGTYRHSTWDSPSNAFTRINRVARDLRFMALLGGVTISSFPDVARPVMTNGFYSTFKTGWVPFVTSMKARKMATNEARLAGQATEVVLQGRVAALAELADPYAQGTAFERYVSNTSRIFGHLTLLNHWNNTMKGIASTITMTRISDLAVGYKGLKPKDRSYLAFLGIDSFMADRMAKQIKAHGEKVDAVMVPHTELWDDEIAARAFRAALNKDVDSTIVTPGVGDKPVWFNTEIGRSVGQFKSFMFAANQRVMLRAAQRQDRGALSGTAMMIGLGAMVYWLKTMQYDPSKLSDDPRVWVAEGIDRSGLIPVMMEANNIAEKVGFPLTFRGLTGGGVASRYASRSLPETLLGPSVGQVTDVALAMRAIFAGEAAEGDVKAFRRLLPFQNLFYLRPLFDMAQEGVQGE